MSNIERAANAIEALSGVQLDNKLLGYDAAIQRFASLATSTPVGFSQFNELLISLGVDAICADYFDFLVTGEIAQGVSVSAQVTTLDELDSLAERAQKLSLLAFGNVKFGFRQFGQKPLLVRDWATFLIPVSTDRFEKRLPSAIPLEAISIDKRPMLGYISGDEIKKKAEKNPLDEAAQHALVSRNEVIEVGKRNQSIYLAIHHLDIYVATSMRKKHEFHAVALFCKSLFESSKLSKLNLNYFDPTLAYAEDRIDKGLSEALMLKRAKLTIFLAQETDTLGKDSELAITLAQGKPVIAFVPQADDDFFNELEVSLVAAYGQEQLVNQLLLQLQSLKSSLAWDDPDVKVWVQTHEDDRALLLDKIRTRFRVEATKFYNNRADMLKSIHPLGIQVKLDSGTATGVLVVRTINSCSELIEAILTNNLKFAVETISSAEKKTHLLLRESISNSIFRVMTYDRSLEKAFWNFYLTKS